MVEVFICTICGEAYIGEEAPTNCPFCGAHKKYMPKSSGFQVNFNMDLDKNDKANAEHALKVEISNSSFYFCAAEKTDDPAGKIMFKRLGKIEAEHAQIWSKILKLDKIKAGNDSCHVKNEANMKEAHTREDAAIKFYAKAASESKNPRLKHIFTALVEIETDHLNLTSSDKR